MRYVYRYRIILDNGKIAGKDLTLEQSEALSAKLGANGIDHVIRSSLIPCPYGGIDCVWCGEVCRTIAE
jgi:hypothetical protein